ncbi:MAG: radical SAM protein [Candidatus Lokiarchaeota archaeon]|nr:radical SAM protein [Candidatus Lokiarchaeota archaeon]
MPYDVVISLIPPYTINTPSLGVVSLYSFLKNKNINCIAFDFSAGFYHNEFKKLKVSNPFSFKINQFSLIGYALWYYKSIDFFSIKDINQQILRSLSPIHLKLYNDLFRSLKSNIHSFYNILERYAEKLSSLNTKHYCFSINITNAIPTLKVIHDLRKYKKDAIIILGGAEVFPTYRKDLYINSELIDYVVYHYEGEIPLYKLIQALNNRDNLESCPGISFKNNDTLISTPLPQSLDLNSLPIPRYDEIEYGRFNFDDFRKLELLISKGCPGNCKFCNEPSIWSEFKSKKTSYLLKEIDHYLNQYGINEFEISDNAFNNTNTFLRALQLLYDEKISLKFGGNCRINNMTIKKLKSYKKMGLTHCFYGLESASQKILDLMNKNLSIQHATDIIKNTSRLGIDTILYLIVGYPAETDDDFNKTLTFLRENYQFINDISINIFTLMNNSPIFYSDEITKTPLPPSILNCYTYRTKDKISHDIRASRFLKIKNVWNSLK